MYCSHFGLHRPPFNNTPDPSFYYSTPDHEEALATLQYATVHRKGFVLVTGEVGAGKTLIGRMFARQIDRQASTAVITHTQLSARQLLAAICTEFELEVTPDATNLQLAELLQEYLLEQFAHDRFVVVLLDEAQNLPDESFEALRMLGNLEADDAKLLQVCILGQPELRDRFRQESMRQLDQRLFRRFHLSGLTHQQTTEYIVRRLQVAGCAGADLFSPEAIEKVYVGSGGIPRVINQVCDNALLAAYAQGRRTVEADTVMQVLEQEGLMARSAPASVAKEAPKPAPQPPVTDESTEARIEQIYGSRPELVQLSAEPEIEEIETPACAVSAAPAVACAVAAEPAAVEDRPASGLRDVVSGAAAQWPAFKQAIDQQRAEIQRSIDSVTLRCRAAEEHLDQVAHDCAPAAAIHELRLLHQEQSQLVFEEIANSREHIRQLMDHTETRLAETQGQLHTLQARAATRDLVEAVERQQTERIEKTLEQFGQYRRHIDELVEMLRHGCDEAQKNLAGVADSCARTHTEFAEQVDNHLGSIRQELQEQRRESAKAEDVAHLREAQTRTRQELAEQFDARLREIHERMQEQSAADAHRSSEIRESVEQIRKTQSQARAEISRQVEDRLTQLRDSLRTKLDEAATTADLAALREETVRRTDLEEVRRNAVTTEDLEVLRRNAATVEDVNTLRQSTAKAEDLEALRRNAATVEDVDNLRQTTAKAEDLEALRRNAATVEDVDILRQTTAKAEDLEALRRNAATIEDVSALRQTTAKAEDLEALRRNAATVEDVNDLRQAAAAKSDLEQLRQEAAETSEVIRGEIKNEATQVRETMRERFKLTMRGLQSLRESQDKLRGALETEIRTELEQDRSRLERHDSLLQEHQASLAQQDQTLSNLSQDMTRQSEAIGALAHRAGEHFNSLNHTLDELKESKVDVDTFNSLRDQHRMAMHEVQSALDHRMEEITGIRKALAARLEQMSEDQRSAHDSLVISLNDQEQQLQQLRQRLVEKLSAMQERFAEIETTFARREDLEQLRQEHADQAARMLEQIQADRQAVWDLMQGVTDRFKLTQERLESLGQAAEVDSHELSELRRVQAEDIAGVLTQMEDQRRATQEQFDKALARWSRSQQEIEQLRVSAADVDALEDLRLRQQAQTKEIRQVIAEHRHTFETLVQGVGHRCDDMLARLNAIPTNVATTDDLQALDEKTRDHKAFIETVIRGVAQQCEQTASAMRNLEDRAASVDDLREMRELQNANLDQIVQRLDGQSSEYHQEFEALNSRWADLREELKSLAQSSTSVEKFENTERVITQDLNALKQQLDEVAQRRQKDVRVLVDSVQRLMGRVKSIEETERPEPVRIELRPRAAEELAELTTTAEKHSGDLRGLLNSASNIGTQLRESSAHVEQVMRDWLDSAEQINEQSEQLKSSAAASGNILQALRKCNEAIDTKLKSPAWHGQLRRAEEITARLEQALPHYVHIEETIKVWQQQRADAEQFVDRLEKLLGEARNVTASLGQVGAMMAGVAGKASDLAQTVQAARLVDDQRRPMRPRNGKSNGNGRSVESVEWPRYRTHAQAQ